MGYVGFKPTDGENQESINVFVVFSDELVAHWQAIDEFEGEEYRRILVKYGLNDGQIGVGFIYAIKGS